MAIPMVSAPNLQKLLNEAIELRLQANRILDRIYRIESKLKDYQFLCNKYCNRVNCSSDCRICSLDCFDECEVNGPLGPIYCKYNLYQDEWFIYFPYSEERYKAFGLYSGMRYNEFKEKLKEYLAKTTEKELQYKAELLYLAVKNNIENNQAEIDEYKLWVLGEAKKMINELEKEVEKIEEEIKRKVLTLLEMFPAPSNPSEEEISEAIKNVIQYKKDSGKLVINIVVKRGNYLIPVTKFEQKLSEEEQKKIESEDGIVNVVSDELKEIALKLWYNKEPEMLYIGEDLVFGAKYENPDCYDLRSCIQWYINKLNREVSRIRYEFDGCFSYSSHYLSKHYLPYIKVGTDEKYEILTWRLDTIREQISKILHTPSYCFISEVHPNGKTYTEKRTFAYVHAERALYVHICKNIVKYLIVSDVSIVDNDYTPERYNFKRIEYWPD